MASPKWFALLLTLATSASAQTPTLDDIAAHYIAANGGRPAIEAVKTVRETGTVLVQSGMNKMNGTVVIEMAPPEHKVRIEINIGGSILIEGYDGQQGWTVDTVGGSARPMSQDRVRVIQRSAQFKGPLLNPNVPGRKIEVLAPTTVGDIPANLVQVTDADGLVDRLYLAQDTGQEIREQLLKDGKPMSDLKVTDYRPVNGVPFASSQESHTESAIDGSTSAVAWITVHFDTVIVNGEVPASDFTAPTGGAAKKH
jgi:hypothetical protein